MPTAARAIPAAIADYSSTTSASPGVGSLAGWRGADGDEVGKGEPNPDQLERLHRQRLLLRARAAARAALYEARQPRLSATGRASMGLIDSARRRSCSSSTARRCRSSASPRGATAPVQPPDGHRERIARYFDPLPFWYPPFEQAAVDGASFPLHAITQRPMAMYHSWGSQNAWLRQIHGANRLYMHRATARGAGPRRRRLGRGHQPPRPHQGADPADATASSPDTVWTWNAIGKRAGAWGLAPTRPRPSAGFLLNHLIGELLPPTARRLPLGQCRPGHRAGGVVRPARCASRRPTGASRRPRRIALLRAAGPAASRRRASRYGARLPRPGAPHDEPAATPPPKRLGLVIDLDTCVGCHACVVNCKEWNTGGHAGPLADVEPYGAEPTGAWLNRVHSFEVGERRGCGRTVHFPRPACIAPSPPASPSARPAPPTSAPRTASCWSTRTSASAAACAPGPAPTARASSTRSSA